MMNNFETFLFGKKFFFFLINFVIIREKKNFFLKKKKIWNIPENKKKAQNSTF